MSILTFVFSSKAQFYSDDYFISIKTCQNKIQNNGFFMSGGIEAQYFISDRFSLNSNFQFGKDYFHIPLGIIPAVIFSLGGKSDSGGCNESSLFLLAEGVSYHQQIAPEVSVSPYINPLALDYVWGRKLKYNTYISGSAGIKLNFIIREKLIFGGHVEYRLLYGESERFFNVGFSCGRLFRFYY